MAGLILSPILYGLFKFGPLIPGLAKSALLQQVSEFSFLDRMSLTFLIVMAVLTAMRLMRPLDQPVDLPVNEQMNLEGSPIAKLAGAVVVGLTLFLYYKFW